MTLARIAVASVAASLAIFTYAATARAQVISADPDRYVSPQHFAVELRFGPYKPDIDSEFSGTNRHPYQDFFGSSRRLMSQLEFDYEFLHHVGTAAIGFGFGYFKETGNNLLEVPVGAPSPDTSTLRLIPLSLSAIYRFDLGWEQYKIPLIPYGKVGLDYVLWTIKNGNGEVPRDPSGGTGSGGTLGWHAAIGLGLMLDFFDPVSANQFDNELGVNHTQLFFEYGHWDVSGLGSPNRLHVGDNTWLAGILFEF